ncbi:MAG: RNA 2',3'-cyclic phosphodiesterase [Dehalococcoidia bacterium]|nr:RNA 2',3'-cyclic phosphodiesterase [Dehalococcoidia bacterium]
MRLFVAIDVPDAWRDAAVQATEALAQASGVRLRPVHPSLMHLTLRFLGEVPEDGVPRLIEALRAAITAFDLELALGPAGTFGPPIRTQVAWLGITGDLEGLQHLAARIESAVRAAGLPPEDRPLRVHLTLARLGRELRPDERRAVAEAARHLDAPPPLPFHAREVLLVRSTLANPRPLYEVLSRFG